jgi:hypothetical protein
MKSIRSMFGSLFLLLLCASGATAQRTFVASTGNDSNPCTRTAPCRTFQVAVNAAPAGGEVVALDSAGYGTFSINKSLTVEAADGVYAGVAVTAPGVGVVVTGSSSAVVLKGLTIYGNGGTQQGGIGVPTNNGLILHVENCVLNGLSSYGIQFLASTLEVKDTIFRGDFFGILLNLEGSVPATSVTMDHVRLEGNNIGLQATSGVVISIRDSVAAANSVGLQAFGNAPVGTLEMNIENCLIANNTTAGIESQASSMPAATATVRVSNSTITNNGTGLSQSGPALLLSRGNNTVQGNTTATSGTIGSYAAQ